MITEAFDDDFDFGFTALDEKEIKASEQELAKKVTAANDSLSEAEARAKAYEQRLAKMHKLILPLLKNLAKDNGKDYIYWPDRQAKIADFMKKLDKLAEKID